LLIFNSRGSRAGLRKYFYDRGGIGSKIFSDATSRHDTGCGKITYQSVFLVSLFPTLALRNRLRDESLLQKI
jgi:hypothetical protein